MRDREREHLRGGARDMSARRRMRADDLCVRRRHTEPARLFARAGAPIGTVGRGWRKCWGEACVGVPVACFCVRESVISVLYPLGVRAPASCQSDVCDVEQSFPQFFLYDYLAHLLSGSAFSCE